MKKVHLILITAIFLSACEEKIPHINDRIVTATCNIDAKEIMGIFVKDGIATLGAKKGPSLSGIPINYINGQIEISYTGQSENDIPYLKVILPDATGNFQVPFEGVKRKRSRDEKRMAIANCKIDNGVSRIGIKLEPEQKKGQVDSKIIKKYAPNMDIIDPNKRKSILSLVDKKINNIAPDQSESNGGWFVTNVEFISSDYALVEYEDGHIISSLLIKITKTKSGYSIRRRL